MSWRTLLILTLMVSLVGCAARPRIAAEYSQDGSGEKPRLVKKQTRYTLVAQSDSTVQYNRGALLGADGAVATNYEPDDATSSDDDFLPRSAAQDEYSLAEAEDMPDRSITQEEGRGMPDGQQGQEPYVAENEGEQLVPGASASDSLRSSFDLDSFANAEIEPMDPKDLPETKKNEVATETASQAVQQSGTSADVKSAIAQMEQAADQQKEITGGGETLAQTLQQDATEANAPTQIQGLPVVTSQTKTESALEEVTKTKLADGKTETDRTILPSETESSTAEAPGPVEMTVPEVTVGKDPTKAEASADAQLAGEMQNMAGEAGTTPPPEAPVDLPVAQKGAPAQEQVVPDDPTSLAKKDVTPSEPAETLAGKEEEVLPPESQPSTLYPDDTAPPGTGGGPSTADMQQQLQQMITSGAEETAESAAGASVADTVATPEAVTDEVMETASETVAESVPTVETPSVDVAEASETVESVLPDAPTVTETQAAVADAVSEATPSEVDTVTKPEPESMVESVTEAVESTAEEAVDAVEMVASEAKDEVEDTIADVTETPAASRDAASTNKDTAAATSESVEETETETTDAAETKVEDTLVAMRDEVEVPALDEMASDTAETVKDEVTEVTEAVEETVSPQADTFRGEEVRKIQPPDPMPDDVAVISTRLGDIVIQLDGKAAPQTVTNFKRLAEDGFFNRTTFHRVIPHFIVQGGDPLSKDGERDVHGEGGPGYVLQPEISRKHKRGAVAAARLPDDVNPLRYSNGSQFYICVVDAPSLDGKNTVFGQVIKGMEVVDKIAVLPRDDNANPLRPLRMDVKVMSREEWEKN